MTAKVFLQRAVRFLARTLLGLAAIAGVAWGGWQFWMHHRAQPASLTQTLAEGVTYHRESRVVPRPVVLHLVTIDLTTPDLRFLVTPPDDKTGPLPLRARTTSAFLQETGASLAINCDFFYPWWSKGLWNYYPHVGDGVTVEGRACSNGVCYTGIGDGRDQYPALFISAQNQVFIGNKPPEGFKPHNVLSGNMFLLRGGKIVVKPDTDTQPRIAAACDKTGKYLYLLLADGRQPNYSEGLTMYELAQALQAIGGWDALNLDGGGSATLAARNGDGTPAVLNSPIDNHLPGRERPVANHLAVFYRAQAAP